MNISHAAHSRRKFLGLAGAAAGTALLGRLPRLVAAEEKSDAKSKYGPFALGIQSYTLRGFKVDEALKHIKDLGLTRVEFFSAHFPMTDDKAKIDEMQKKLDGHGIKISAHGVNGFGSNHEQNRKWFEFAKAAGFKVITADPDEKSFASLDKLVKEFDIRIAIHNHGPGHRYDKINDVLRAVKDYDKRIGACADLGHYIRSGEDPVKAVNLLGERLYGIHLKDFDQPKGNAKGVILGQGQLDVAGVLKELKKVSFPADGALSLEYEEKANDPIDDVKACLAVVAEAAAKAFG